MTVVKLLSVLVVLTFAADLALHADAAERRRGVKSSSSIGGIVVAVSADSLTLRNAGGDHNLQIARLTKVSGEVTTGAQARVHYRLDRDNLMVALSVNAISEPIELHGVVLSLSDTGFVLQTRGGEMDLSIDEQTIFVVEGSPSTFEGLVVGDHVEVEAMYSETGALVAQLVVAEVDNIELHGVIFALSPDTMSLETATGVIDVSLPDDAVVRLFGHEATLADLRVGMHVEVEAASTDGELSALVIEVEDDFDLVEIEGAVVEVSATEIRLLSRHGEEVTIAISPDTIVMWEDEGFVTPADLEPGDHVEVKAVRNGEGGLTAIRIKVDNEEEDLDEVDGLILSVEGSVLTIAPETGAPVTILTGDPTVVRIGREPGSVADLVPGRRVEVRVEVNPDGSLTAVSIKVELEDDEDEFEIHGIVSNLTDDSITVATMHDGDLVITVTGDTIVRRHHETIAFSEVQIGDSVEVEGVAGMDGTLTATKIDVEDEAMDDEHEFEGEVTDVSPTSITILGPDGEWTFEVTSDTSIRIDNTTATIDDIVVGDDAEIEGRASDGALVAKKIEIEREDD